MSTRQLYGEKYGAARIERHAHKIAGTGAPTLDHVLTVECADILRSGAGLELLACENNSQEVVTAVCSSCMQHTSCSSGSALGAVLAQPPCAGMARPYSCVRLELMW